MKKLILSALSLSIVIVGILTALPAQTRTQPASATQTSQFDHSTCQYPDRWSNPAYGCDNGDPAVPECIKEMYSEQAEKDCIAAFVKQNEQPKSKPVKKPKSVKNSVQCESHD